MKFYEEIIKNIKENKYNADELFDIIMSSRYLSERDEIYNAIIDNKETPAPILYILAEISDEEIRAKIAKNAENAYIHYLLVNDESDKVLVSLAYNENIYFDIIDRLIEKKHLRFELSTILAEHPNLTKEQALTIFKWGYARSNCIIVRRGKLLVNNQELQYYIAIKGDKNERKILARNKYISRRTMWILANDIDKDVLESLLTNETINEDVKNYIEKRLDNWDIKTWTKV